MRITWPSKVPQYEICLSRAYLPVRAGRQDLALVGVEVDVFEERALEEAHEPRVVLEVPDDAGPVAAARERLLVVAAKLVNPALP